MSPLPKPYSKWLSLPGTTRDCYRGGDITGGLAGPGAGGGDTGGTNTSSTEWAEQLLCSGAY